MGSWNKARNKAECLSIALNRKRRLFYSWAVVLPKFSGKSCLMMRVKTLSKDKFVSLEVCWKEKRYFHFRLSRVAQKYFCSLFPPHKKKRFPRLHKVCVRASREQNTCSVMFLLFSFELNLFWGPCHSLGKGNKISNKVNFLTGNINNYIQFFLSRYRNDVAGILP